MQQPMSPDAPRVLADRDEIRFVELSASYQGDVYWNTFQRVETAFTIRPTAVVYQLDSADTPKSLELTGAEMTNLITGYLTFLADHHLASPDPALLNAFAAYIHAAEQPTNPPDQHDDSSSNLDDHPF